MTVKLSNDNQATGSLSTGAANFCRPRNSQRWRALLSILASLAGSTLGILTLAHLNASTEAVPWYCTIAFIAALCGVESMRTVLTSDRQFASPIKIRQTAQEPISLLESWSFAFALAASLLFGYVSLRSTPPTSVESKLTRFVDIQLVSTADFEDQKSPLPGMQQQQLLHKRQSDQTTQQGSLMPRPITTVARKMAAATGSKQAQGAPSDKKQEEQKHGQDIKAIENKQVKPATTASKFSEATRLSVSSQSQKPAPETRKKVEATANRSQSFFEEVQPPELVELMENDGARDATRVFTSGGKSQGGTGAATELSIYIKDLHHKIKSSWSPPRGQSRRAKVLFRIRHDGKLAFVKIVVGSGDDDTDVAAVNAITQAVGSKSLPADYKMPYLDVEYAFNYTADEIKEIR